jgi:hypothetical protein
MQKIMGFSPGGTGGMLRVGGYTNTENAMNKIFKDS